MKHSGQTVLWELWAALCLCTALVLPPGSPWLHEPALLYPGLSLAAVGPPAWGGWGGGGGPPPGAAAAVAAGAAAGTGAAAKPCRTVRDITAEKTKTPVPVTRHRGFVRQSNCAIKRSC